MPARTACIVSSLACWQVPSSFTVAGTVLSYVAPNHPTFVAVTLVVLLAVAAALRASRIALWQTAPLEFDAVHDDRPQTLGICL